MSALKILMIDDEPQYLIFHVQALEEDFTVRIETDLDNAIELLNTQDFCLVILDLLMPPKKSERQMQVDDVRLTGVKLYHEIQNIKLKSTNKSIPVIVMSAVRDEQILSQLPKPIFLQKPVPIDELLEAVKQALK